VVISGGRPEDGGMVRWLNEGDNLPRIGGGRKLSTWMLTRGVVRGLRACFLFSSAWKDVMYMPEIIMLYVGRMLENVISLT
jgi:hypothetical protein